MNIQLEQLLGTWRNIDEKDIITDFKILEYDMLNDTHKSLFTMFKIENGNSKLIYEWRGVPSIINLDDGMSEITISKITFTEDNPIYQNLKIWSFRDNEMTLEYSNGQRVTFNKLNR